MDYKKIYEQLIDSRKNKPKIPGQYYERHHIVPFSMSKDNNEKNLIYLSAREHFLAHWLLWRIHRNRQTAYAFWCMCNWNTELQKLNRKFSSIVYAEAKEACHIVGKSEEFKQKVSEAQIGKKMSDETKKKISDSLKNRSLSEEHKLKIKNTRLANPVSDEAKKKISEFRKGKLLSDETKKKISESLKHIKYPNRKKVACSCETKRKISESKKGKPISEEHKKKISESLTGTKLNDEVKNKIAKSRSNTVWIKNEVKQKQKTVKKELVEMYLNDGWERGCLLHTKRGK